MKFADLWSRFRATRIETQDEDDWTAPPAGAPVDFMELNHAACRRNRIARGTQGVYEADPDTVLKSLEERLRDETDELLDAVRADLVQRERDEHPEPPRLAEGTGQVPRVEEAGEDEAILVVHVEDLDIQALNYEPLESEFFASPIDEAERN